MGEKEYIIFCDESDKVGEYYSNFYGGLIVGGSQYQRVTNRLNQLKLSLNLFGEIKWSKVTEQYLKKYQELMCAFFEEVAQGNIRIRIMFRQNAQVPQHLTQEQQELEYFKLYYQFIKHGFGFAYMETSETKVRLRIYFDEVADTRERIEQFRGYIQGLEHSREFHAVGIVIPKRSVSEVHSHDHVLLQCLDVVLGAMSFRLNEKHRDKLPGQRRRGRRTIAKEKLYRAILGYIRTIRPRFNIGISTSTDGDVRNRWHSPYMHWCFRANGAQFDSKLTKRGKKINPACSTSASDA